MNLIGYAALSLNIVSMSMKNVFYLRVCSMIANAIYIVYGILLNAPPIIIGCSIAVLLHVYRIYQILKEKRAIQTHPD